MTITAINVRRESAVYPSPLNVNRVTAAGNEDLAIHISFIYGYGVLRELRSFCKVGNRSLMWMKFHKTI